MKYLTILFLALSITITEEDNMNNGVKDKRLVFELTLNAQPSEVYKAWTTKEGIESFLAPSCEVNLKMFGDYFIYFLPENPPGTRGAEDEKVISFEENRMFSFTWGMPPIFPYFRKNQKTIVLIRLEQMEEGKTKMLFMQSGWGYGEEWRKSYDYFEQAWGNVVLPRLQYRFEDGPVNWENPADYSKYKLVKEE